MVLRAYLAQRGLLRKDIVIPTGSEAQWRDLHLSHRQSGGLGRAFETWTLLNRKTGFQHK
jgi:hypothetical protein